MLNNATNATEFINELAAHLKPVVSEIETSFAITQHHYADYMAVISKLSKGNMNAAKGIALALIQAGGNKDGILAAMRLI